MDKSSPNLSSGAVELLEDGEQVELSPACHPLAAGNPGDTPATPEEVSAVISILSEAGICCCFVQEFALIYYGAARVPNVCCLCRFTLPSRFDR
jgi:hypothetical protein